MKQNIKKTIGIVIMKIRNDMNLSQTEFGKKIKRRGSSISNWENGIKTPTMVKYREVLDLYNAFLEKKNDTNL